MDVEIKMPDLGTTEDHVKVVRWLIEPGQPVKLGQPLLEVETDKATMEVESVAAGRLKSVSAQPDDDIDAGQVIAVIEKAGAAAAPSKQTPVRTPGPPPPVSPKTQAAAPKKAARSKGRSMFMRNREAAANRHSGASQTLSLSRIQEITGTRLQQSKQSAPHFYLQASANAEPLITARKAAGATPPAWDAFFVKAVAHALGAFERVGARLDGNRLKLDPKPSIGVAVDIDDELYVIAVSDPAGKNVHQVSEDLRQHVEKMHQGDAEARRMTPTALTITNLGAEGIESFMAIINPPEAAILAIGTTAPTPVAVGDQVKIQQRVHLCLSVDHRVVNGKYAAKFLRKVIETLESTS